MSEESFLRYRLEVVRLMPEGEHKRALIAAINRSLVTLSGAGTSPRDSRAVRLLAGVGCRQCLTERAKLRGSWVISRLHFTRTLPTNQ
jgi:hypothetical protein